jgi:formate-dependent nitrite reductase cytochrome c552 subunit
VASDERRQEIAWIQVKEGDEITEYSQDGETFDVDNLEPEAIRQMDCIDCHNRPTHVFELPGEAMDNAMYSGRISPSIPYIKKAGVEILTEVGNSLGAPEQVVQKLRTYYRENHPDFYNSDRQSVEAAVREIEAIYRRNVSPEMRLTWGTYPNNIGHQNFPGCFRCHDSEHESSDGRVVEQDCESCHTILAWDEENPEILQQLGIEQ